MKFFKKIPPKIVFLLKLTTTIVLCVLIIWKVDWPNVWLSLKTTNVYWIIAAFSVMILSVFLSALKWKILLDIHSINFSLMQLFKFYFSGSFFNNFLPSTIGGDSYRIIKTFQNGKNKTGSYLAVFMDRLTGVFFLILMGVAGALIAFVNYGDKLSKYFLLSGTAILIILITGFVMIKFKGFELKKLLLKYIPFKMKGFFRAIEDYKGKNYHIFLITSISILFNLLLVFSRVFMLFSVNQSCTYLDLVIVVAASNIISLLPVTINGIGLKDATFVYLLAHYGVSYDPAVVVAVLVRALNIPLSLIGGIYYMIDKNSAEVKKIPEREFQTNQIYK
jgi:glycosyltransferase 2 family protein